MEKLGKKIERSFIISKKPSKRIKKQWGNHHRYMIKEQSGVK